VEGPTDDAKVLALRHRQQRNFLATLFLSQGVPMLLGGDEMGRSQGGNNNAYCQDNEVSWFDWDTKDDRLLDFAAWLIKFRKDHPSFRRRRFFQGRALHGGGADDIAWFRPDGTEMTEDDWSSGFAKSLGVFLNGEAIPTPGPRGERITDDTFYLVFNAHHGRLHFTLPPEQWGRRWAKVLDTNEPEQGERKRNYRDGEKIRVESRALVLMRRVDE
ncbi:MAG: glycogen debranching enzyme, partial [Actinomycetota bacterium]